MSIDLLLDLFIAVFGAYFIYISIRMKQTGEIPKGVIVKKDADLTRAKDIPGFIDYMYIKTIVLGALTIICGGVGIYSDLHGGIAMLQLIMTFVFFAVVVIFGIIASKAQKKYLDV